MLLSAGKCNVIQMYCKKVPVTIETPSIIEFPLSLFIISRAQPELSKVTFEKNVSQKA